LLVNSEIHVFWKLYITNLTPPFFFIFKTRIHKNW
jgi:hypothetical protein